MSVTLTIVANTATELVQEFRAINTETTGASITTLADTPLDALIDMVRERLRDDGFKLEIIDQRDPNPPTSPPPEMQPDALGVGLDLDKLQPDELPAPKKAKGKKPNGAAVSAEVITEPTTTADEDVTSPKKASKTPSKPLVALDEPEAEPDPAGDRQHVLDTLASILKDPKAKNRVLTFASSMAKKHGKDKISELPVEPFPEIRRAMEKEFPNA